MTESLDPRVTPARPDIAASYLAGRVSAARFVEGETRVVIDPQAPLRQAPSPDAALDTEALMGERVTVYETNDEGYAWGQLNDDKYVGWLPSGSLAPPGPPPTHKVAVLRTLVFPGPSIKLPPIAALPLGARLVISREDRSFAITPAGGHLPAGHLVPVDAVEPDFVAVAERFVGTPYLWGGKTSLGLDCSGLTQVALAACGVAAPRDTDMMERGLGVPVDLGRLARGDLIFWKGHVAIARDPTSIVHANAYHMAVTIEPLVEAVARIRATASEVTSVRRIAT